MNKENIGNLMPGQTHGILIFLFLDALSAESLLKNVYC